MIRKGGREVKRKAREEGRTCTRVEGGKVRWGGRERGR
jgi:hypothetical protein